MPAPHGLWILVPQPGNKPSESTGVLTTGLPRNSVESAFLTSSRVLWLLLLGDHIPRTTLQWQRNSVLLQGLSSSLLVLAAFRTLPLSQALLFSHPPPSLFTSAISPSLQDRQPMPLPASSKNFRFPSFTSKSVGFEWVSPHLLLTE